MSEIERGACFLYQFLEEPDSFAVEAVPSHFLDRRKGRRCRVVRTEPFHLFGVAALADPSLLYGDFFLLPLIK